MVGQTSRTNRLLAAVVSSGKALGSDPAFRGPHAMRRVVEFEGKPTRVASWAAVRRVTLRRESQPEIQDPKVAGFAQSLDL